MKSDIRDLLKRIGTSPDGVLLADQLISHILNRGLDLQAGNISADAVYRAGYEEAIKVIVLALRPELKPERNNNGRRTK